MNRLADAMSPYLQQHANNPVQWREWTKEALAEAKQRDVPLFISIGYAACHWCHVMAHESFDDPDIANTVNALTVPVKVDREERPDLDAVYMQATLALTGQGGWPMTIFAAPDGTPFYAGTYFPKEQFHRLVEAVSEAWTTQRDNVMKQGNAIVEACASAGPKLADVTQACPIDGPCPPVSPISRETLDNAATTIVQTHDRTNGGFGGAPKFPTQPALAFLQDWADQATHGADNARDVVTHTMNHMVRGGIYDQLAGGFARYSVDATWTVPHFEKMLYDNALLLTTLHRACNPTEPSRLLADAADATARFLTRDLGTPEGGFASALDADTEGTEGTTYVWTRQQLRETLGDDDGDWAANLFNVTETGTFEHGTSVLQLPTEPDDLDRYHNIRDRLFQARTARPQPDRDDKVVAAWNGLAVTALTRYAAEHTTSNGWPYDTTYADTAAEQAALLLANQHIIDGRLRRVSRDGTVGKAAGTLEDYAAVTTAFCARYHATKDKTWLDRAKPLIDTIVERFTSANGGFYDTANDAEALVNRPGDPTDGPTPSGWALAVDALLNYSECTGEDSYYDVAWRGVGTAEPVVKAHPRFAGGVASAAVRMLVR